MNAEESAIPPAGKVEGPTSPSGHGEPGALAADDGPANHRASEPGGRVGAPLGAYMRAGVERSGLIATQTALHLDDNLSEDDWQDIGRRLSRAQGAWQWWVGDWFLHGDRRFGVAVAAAEAVGIEPASVRTCAWVAAQFDPSRRREGVSYSAHKAVAALPEAEADRILAGRPTVREARDAAQAWQAENAPPQGRLDLDRASRGTNTEIPTSGAPETAAAGLGVEPEGVREDYGKLAPLMSSDSDEWTTPEHVWRAALDALRIDAFDLDPCAEAARAVAARRHYTIDDDGLAQDWRGAVWLNPPYSAISTWVDRLIRECAARRVRDFVALVPARTDTAWWAVLTQGAGMTAVFVRGRLRFGAEGVEAPNSAPFPSALVFAAADPDDVADACAELGRVWRPW